MNKKINRLKKEYPKDLEVVVNNLYNEKFPKGDDFKHRYRALGNEYESATFVGIYKSFLYDVSKILPYDKLTNVISNSYLSTDENRFEHNENIGGLFYVNTKTSTEQKKGHIKKVCKYLNINFEEVME